jgi:outer membrane protein assembly factor BamB
VAGESVFVFDRVDEEERLTALDRATGKERWSTRFPARYRGGVDSDTGPRCVPLVHGDRVVVWGAAGVAHCVEASTGKALWSRDLRRDFRSDDGYFGAGSTPIVSGDHVVFHVGGSPGAALVALQLADGTTAWKVAEDDASYSSPTRIPGSKPETIVFVTRLHALVVEGATGKVLFERPFGRRGPTVNAASPIIFGDYLFLTANYGVGAALMRWDGHRAKVVWENDESLSSQYNTPLEFDGYLYGVHGREDIGRAELRCVEAMTGKVIWKVPDYGVAHLIRADGRALSLRIDGQLQVIELTREAFRGSPPRQVSDQTARALPALSRGQFWFRDQSANGGTLWCLSLQP